MDDPDVASLENSLGVKFNDRSLLKTALTHSSAAPDGGSNERMEFLGDRVLGLVIAEFLYVRYADESEGALARRHADLVSRSRLAQIARALDLGAFISVAPGDLTARDNASILADCCEALICALYLDGGLAPARTFIISHWEALIEEMSAPPVDAKSKLQERAQAQGFALPSYTEIDRSGPDHAPLFTIEVRVEGGGAARGMGASKRIAEQNAAEALLQELDS